MFENFFAILIFSVAMVGSPGPASMILLAVGAKYRFKNCIGFVVGVVLSKQLIIWPIGLGFAGIIEIFPFSLFLLKISAAVYIFWLTVKVWRKTFEKIEDNPRAPGFISGLIIHPLNPKAWAMILVSFSSFSNLNTNPVYNTLFFALLFLIVQSFFHSLWCFCGSLISSYIAGSRYERPFFITLAVSALGSILWVLFIDDLRWLIF